MDTAGVPYCPDSLIPTIDSETSWMLCRTAYRESLKGIVQFTCSVRDDRFVAVHINDFLDAKGAILMIVNYEWAIMNVVVSPTRHRLEVVLRYLDGGAGKEAWG